MANHTQEELTTLIVARLREAEQDLGRQWENPKGTRTRHFILENLLPEAIAHEISEAFPRDGEGFADRASFRERKKTLAQLGRTDPLLGAISVAFQDPRVIEAVGRVTGMDHLEPDRSFYAGGLSMMFPGDFLNPHIDNSHDGERQRYRRMNLLYYVNPGWDESCGGNFELWDDAVETPKTLVSGFNRLVVMETNKHSWHSVSKVQADRPRCCVSNYYFSAVSPDGGQYFHVTSFTGRPGELVKRVIGPIDNGLRNAVLKTFKSLVPGKQHADDIHDEHK